MRMPSAELTIRPMRAGDAARVAELCGQLGYPSTVEEVRKRFRTISTDANQEFSVAETAEGEIIAWVHLCLSGPMVSGKRAEIWGLVVDEARRGRGVGERLMEFAETWARSKGCGSVLLKSNVVRDRAHAFYGRLGYRTVKTQYVFRKELEPSP